MQKYINILICAISMTLSSLSMASSQPWYNYAGIVPVIKDSKNQAWIYMGVEYINNEKRLALLAGQKDKKDQDVANTALREFNEESLDVFSSYINLNKLNQNNIPQIEYNLLFLIHTKLYLFVINNNLNNNLLENNCDKFIDLYNKRRYNGQDNYKKLKLAQRESYELRKVKLNDLIDFLNAPHKSNPKLMSYGGKNCDENSIPLRWSSKIILKNQPSLKSLVN